MYFFLKYIVTLFYKKLRIKIVVSFLRESGPWILKAIFIKLLKYRSNISEVSDDANTMRQINCDADRD